MEKLLLKFLDVLFSQSELKRYKKEDFFVSVVKKCLLKKYQINTTDYFKLLNNKLKEMTLNCDEIKINDEIYEMVTNINPLSLCSISEKFIGEKKREITGSYYTPLYVVDFIVYDSLRLYFEENLTIDKMLIKKMILEENISNIDTFQLQDILKLLDKVKIIDIACGTGLFLLKMIQKLFKIKHCIYKKLKLNFDEFREMKKIIEENIFGIDIQNMPLEIFSLACIDILAKYKEFDIKDLCINVYQENSILGNRIYDFSRLTEVINKGGFDIVIGNPPYIGEKGNKDKFENIKMYEFGKKYYEGKMDYFYFFIYRGIDILKNNGVLSFITTNYFITADGAAKLRGFLRDNVCIRTIINFNECEIFKAAKGQHNLIFSITKGVSPEEGIKIKYFNSKENDYKKIKEIIFNNDKVYKGVSMYELEKQKDIFGDNGNLLIFYDKKYSSIINKINKKSKIRLGDFCNVNQGIVSGADKITKYILNNKLSSQYLEKINIELDEGIFVLDKEELKSVNLFKCKLLKPFFKNSDIKKYFTKSQAEKYILYLTDNNIEDDKLCPAISNHLVRFKEILMKRREVAKGVRKWHSLQWSREQDIFEKPKIVVPHRAILNNFGYNEWAWYASADVYFITSKAEDVELKLLLGILNSKIIYFWLYNMGKRKGNYLELYSRPLKEIPIYIDFDSKIKELIRISTEKILKSLQSGYYVYKVNYYQEFIDRELYKVYDLNDDEIEIINELYNQAQNFKV